MRLCTHKGKVYAMKILQKSEVFPRHAAPRPLGWASSRLGTARHAPLSGGAIAGRYIVGDDAGASWDGVSGVVSVACRPDVPQTVSAPSLLACGL